MSQAPRPVGVDEAAQSHVVSTPLLPPASPRRGLAVTTTSQSFTVSSANSSAPLQPHPAADRTALLPVLTSTFDCPPRAHSSRQQQQQQHRGCAVRRTSQVSALSPTTTLAPPPPAPTASSSPHSPQGSTPAAAVFSNVVVHPNAHDCPLASSPSPHGDTVVHTVAAASASVTTATPRHRQANKPPMMNATLFAPSATMEGVPSPHVIQNNVNTHNAQMSASSFSAATSPMMMTTSSTATSPAEPSRTNLILYNVAPHMTEDVLRGLFDVFGEVVSCAVMREIHTGESLGTAFVRFATNVEARRALSAFSDRTRPVLLNDSKPLVVQWARRRHDDNPVGEARKKIMKLFVRNIPMDCTVETLEALFARYGGVRQVTLHKDTAPVEDAAMERLIAFVIYTEEGAAERAATAVHNTKPFASCNGVPVMIKLAESSQRRRFLRNPDGTTTSAANSPMAGAGGGGVIVNGHSRALSATASPVAFNAGRSSSGPNVSAVAASPTLFSASTPHRAHGGANAPLAPPSSTAASPPPPPQLPAAAAVSAHRTSYDVPMLPETFPSSYLLPTMEMPALYPRTDGTETAMTAGDYGMTEVLPYSPSNHVTDAVDSSGNGVILQPYTQHNAAVLGLRRSASYAHLPTHGTHLQHVGPYDYEDMMSVESMSRTGGFGAGRGGGSITGISSYTNGCGGGYASAGSRSHSRNHTANSMDASLTGYGTDRGSLSSKSTTASLAESAHGNGGFGGGGGGVPAGFGGLRGASSSSKSWFSANDSSTNTSVHAAMAGYPMPTTAAATRGLGYTSSGGVSAAAAAGMVGDSHMSAQQQQPQHHYSPCVPSAPSFHGRTRASLPAPAIIPTGASGSSGTTANVSTTSIGGATSTGDRPAGVQYRLYPGKAYLANAAGASVIAGNSSTHLNTPGKPPSLLINSVSTLGTTLSTTSNDNSTSSSAVVQPNADAPVQLRRAVLTHTQQRRHPDGEAGPAAVAKNPLPNGGGGHLATPTTATTGAGQPSAAVFSIPVGVSDAVEVVPRASPPKLPSATANPRRASASAPLTTATTTAGGQLSSPRSTANTGTRASGGATAAPAANGSATSPSGATRTRYYNNPYSPNSPKLYC